MGPAGAHWELPSDALGPTPVLTPHGTGTRSETGVKPLPALPLTQAVFLYFRNKGLSWTR